MSVKRIQKDLNEINSNPHAQFTIGPEDTENLLKWKGKVLGAEGSPYEGGTFNIEMTFPSNYPFHAPKVVFKTPIFHPNIDSSGRVCEHAYEQNWSFKMTPYNVLLAIVSTLNEPDPETSLNTECGHLYETDREKYNQIAREWTEKYAK